MALERDPAHLGDIGDEDPEKEPDPDRVYEQEAEQNMTP
ncbi:hypothetical protein HASA104033_01905 [Halobacterium salinarum]|uniref:Uncharacterized protein n=1 Tax=Halobacterium salinarum (strain ATCC 33171 / DSM 3754 / JCM 8978 / NBRC 102687 / NCIMB 764 / 91-R6) TaxID=2597657 RepID=A0A4D6GUG0_HALS9|nr:uncharacterized protein HBSAL_08760 [Halobacterium salinarum]